MSFCMSLFIALYYMLYIYLYYLGTTYVSDRINCVGKGIVQIGMSMYS
jgi:hypothetical protein